MDELCWNDGSILVIRQSNIFWYWHHPNEWDLAPTNDMHNKNTKISSFFEVYGGRTCAAVVSKAYIEAEFSITVSDGEYKSLTQELNRKEVLIESI